MFRFTTTIAAKQAKLSIIDNIENLFFVIYISFRSKCFRLALT